jgi:hypothetical protein
MCGGWRVRRARLSAKNVLHFTYVLNFLILSRTVYLQAFKNKIYTPLHFFLQFIYNARQRGCVRLDMGSAWDGVHCNLFLTNIMVTL